MGLRTSSLNGDRRSELHVCVLDQFRAAGDLTGGPHLVGGVRNGASERVNFSWSQVEVLATFGEDLRNELVTRAGELLLVALRAGGTADAGLSGLTVTAQGSTGLTDAAYAASVTLTAYSNSGCTTAISPASNLVNSTATAASGVTDFGSAQYIRTGTIYLKAASGALVSPCSSAISISAGTAVQLAGAPLPQIPSTPVIWRVMLASEVPAGSARVAVSAL